MSPAPPAGAATVAKRDCLRAIYELSGDGRRVSTRRVAEHLGVSDPSASRTMRLLHEHGLLLHRRYRGATLTDAGEVCVRDVLRQDRLPERYLASRLGMPADLVDAEDDRLEHQISAALGDRIAVALGLPPTDVDGRLPLR